jgi:predicted metal-dependent phosphoesterase TrpH
MRVDLHMHSTASDGAYSPAEVVQIALTHQMDVIALTDHDSVSGVLPAQEAAAATHLEVLGGIELSAEDEQTDRHILGYLLDPGYEPLQTALAELREERTSRAQRIVQKLDALGVKIPIGRVYELADRGSVGRPHIARAIVEQGYVGSVQEAFDRYIGNDGPAYVPHYPLEPARAIDLIHSAGGVAVLAHPGHYADYRAVIQGLAPLGLDGLEVYYPDHTPALTEELEMLAHRYELVMTVGSDFHHREGDGSARIGSVRTPPNLRAVERLRERQARYRQ